MTNVKLGDYEATPVEETFEQSTPNLIQNKDGMLDLEDGNQLQLLELQFDINVAMSGGALASVLDAYKLIDSLTMEICGMPVYSDVSGDELRHLHEEKGVFGHARWAAVSPESLPGDGGNQDFVVNIPLLWPDEDYHLGEVYHCYPSEILKHTKLRLNTAANSAFDANATVTGTVRVKAYGNPGGDVVMAPIPEFEDLGAPTAKLVIQNGEQDSVIRNLFSVDTSGFAAHSSEADELKIDGKLFYPPGHTVGEMLEKQELRERIQSLGLLNRNATTGAQTGITDETYPTTNRLTYISGRYDLGDSPVHRAKKVQIKPASERQLYVWRYRKTTASVLEQIKLKSGFNASLFEHITHTRGQFKAAPRAMGTVLPVRLARRSAAESVEV